MLIIFVFHLRGRKFNTSISVKRASVLKVENAKHDLNEMKALGFIMIRLFQAILMTYTLYLLELATRN